MITSGMKFGKLTVLDVAVKAVHGKPTKYNCLCECGRNIIVSAGHLNSGHTKSCGCLKRRGSPIVIEEHHGQSNTPLYKVWQAMKDRCLNKRNRFYNRYGGRGISVCNEWLYFSKFYDWAMSHGYEKGLNIDRIDNDGNYEPSNCRWITHAENLLNTHRRVDIVTRFGKFTIPELAREYGQLYSSVYTLYARGKTGDEIIDALERRKRNHEIRNQRATDFEKKQPKNCSSI